MYPCEIKDMSQVWVNSLEPGNDGIDLPLLVGFTTDNDHPPSVLDVEHPAASANANPRRTLRERLIAFHRKPNVLPTTTAQTNAPETPKHLHGTLQFATLITMPSPRTSKLYNTSVNTSCNLSSPIHPSTTPDGTSCHNSDVVEVLKPQIPVAPPHLPEGLSTFHIGVCCTKPFMLDRCLIPPEPTAPPPARTETRRRRNTPLLPMYGVGYAGGAGVMIVQAPPRPSRNEESEEWGHETWMWRAF